VQSTNPRERHLIIGVFADEPAVIAGLRSLQRSGLSLENIAIVGRGYRSPDAVGFADPLKVARTRALRTAIGTGTIGAVFGLVFNLITKIQIVPGNLLLTWLIAALLGGLSGVMGGLIAGGSFGLIFESGESISYRNRVEKGKFLLLVEGSEQIVRTAEEQMRALPTEGLERYYFRQ